MDYDTIYRALETMENGNNVSENRRHGKIGRAQSVVTSSLATRHLLSVPLSLEQEGAFLLVPLLLYKIISLISVRLGSLLFVIASLIALRSVILQQLLTVLRVMPSGKEQNTNELTTGNGATTCHFTVDLKGVLRFLANEKEAKNQLGRSGSEILMSHILVRSVGKAMGQLPHLVSRKYPTLPALYSVDVVLHDHNTKHSYWVSDADEMSVQDIADFFTVADPLAAPKSLWQSVVGASCHIFTTPDSDHSQVDLGLNLRDIPITVCVSGIRLETDTKSPSLSVAINIQSTDIESSRMFAEAIQQLIQFPEMLE